MTTKTELHHQNPRSVAISELLDHGSISFGRFSAESLAWEKWSVFSHNKCQEELEKFKAPGFVAQKKAFFEEYYKKLREMKGLQAKQQQELQVGIDASLLKEEKNSKIINPIRTLDNDTNIANFDASLVGIEEKQEVKTNEVLINLSSKKETTESFCSTETKQLKKTRNSVITQHREIMISKNVKNIVNNSKPQVNVASSGNLNKLGSSCKKDGLKSSENMKPSINDKFTVKADKSSVVLGKNSTLKASNGHNTNHRKTTESFPGSSAQITSLSRNRPKDSSMRNTINLGNRVEFCQRSRDKERKQDELQGKSDTVNGRVSKFITITSSSNQKSSKSVHKKMTLQPTNPAQSRKVEARPKTPSWR